MANLKVDKITTGIGSYHGSTYASGTGAYLLTTVTAPRTDDFTIECYINTDQASGSNQDGIFAINASSTGFQSNTTNQIRLTLGRDGTDGQNGGLEVNIVGTSVGTGDGNDIIQEGTWHHVAVTRASGTVKIWVDGVEKASGSAAGDVDGTTFITAYYDSLYTYQGYMSNFRYRKGTAHYTTTFTVPTKPFERTSDTELIFAQSSHNASNGFSSAIHGGTTNIMQVNGNVTANDSSPTQLSDASGIGVVFNGPIKQNTQDYMYFPTGSTEERGGGIGIVAGGYSAATSPIGTIESIRIQTMGNSIKFGTLNAARFSSGVVASTSRVIFGGGYQPSNLNSMEFVNPTTQGNGTDAGDLSAARKMPAGLGNSTRGIFAGGLEPGVVNTIEYVTIASLGDAVNFGDLLSTMQNGRGCASSTRGVVNCAAYPAGSNEINYITIASTGDGTDFGNLTADFGMTGFGLSDGTRGVIGGYYTSPANTNSNIINFVTIATTGDATDFGDMVTGTGHGGCGFSDKTRGVITGQYTNSPFQTAPLNSDSQGAVNLIQMITVQTTGNAIEFGDLVANSASNGRKYYANGNSNSHGGLS
tara:strand:+ start:892 stop:2652 length:1761 start_codon:yes stop_codon:yes gene_type:complete